MELATVVVYVDDGAVPAALEFYERALGLTRRFYDPDYQFGELAGRGTVTLAVAAHVTGERLMPAGYERPSLGTRVANTEVAFTTDNVRGAFTRAVAAGAKVLAPAVRTALGAGGRVRPCAGRHALGIVRAAACPWDSGEHARAAGPLTNRCS